MLRTVLSTLFIAVVACGWVGAQESRPATIRVLVEDRIENPMVEVTGRHRIINPQTGERIAQRFFPKRHRLVAKQEGIHWVTDFPRIHQLAIVPVKPGTSVLVNGVQYSGVIYVYQIGARFSIVNEIPLDHYCKVVLATQLPKPINEEVMAALAIAERTTAYYHVGRRREGYWHVRGDEVGYQGNSVLHKAPAVLAAVDGTRGMVMEEDAQPFSTTWTEDCAGRTAPFSVMFRTPGSDESVESNFAAHHREESNWKVVVPKEWLAEGAGLQDVTHIDLYSDPYSKKVYAVRLFDHDESVNIDFTRLCEIVGNGRLRSSDFSVKLDETNVQFRGYGTGHGVGICLYTAQQMADRGKDAADMLKLFYPRACLTLIGSSSR